LTSFFKKIKDIFDDIPSKTKFLEDLQFNGSYIGFRYFLQERNDTPSDKFMDKLCDEMNYDYIKVPIKRGQDPNIVNRLYNDFTDDLQDYVEPYSSRPTRTFAKSKPGTSTVSNAVAAFETERDLLDPDKILDVNDLF